MASKKPASTSKSAPAIDIGIKAGDRAKVAEGLSRFLADSYTLYLKTHNFHWNVTGPMFNSLHLMFMELKAAFVKGKTVPVTLSFARAGTVTVGLTVGGIAASAPPGAADASMGGMKM